MADAFRNVKLIKTPILGVMCHVTQGNKKGQGNEPSRLVYSPHQYARVIDRMYQHKPAANIAAKIRRPAPSKNIKEASMANIDEAYTTIAFCD